jgi:hypothetical protein
VPDAVVPLYTFTATSEESPGASPAVPAKVGNTVAMTAPSAGVARVTTGGVVSGEVTVNVLVELVPTLPAASACSARAVYVPASGEAAATE